MTYSINWPITVRSAVPFRSGNYYGPFTLVTFAGAHYLQGCRPDALTGDVPQYLRQFVRVADVPSRHRLQSYTSDDLIVPAVRLTSIGSRAFPVAGARLWNTLPLPHR